MRLLLLAVALCLVAFPAAGQQHANSFDSADCSAEAGHANGRVCKEGTALWVCDTADVCDTPAEWVQVSPSDLESLATTCADGKGHIALSGVMTCADFLAAGSDDTVPVAGVHTSLFTGIQFYDTSTDLFSAATVGSGLSLTGSTLALGSTLSSSWTLNNSDFDIAWSGGGDVSFGGDEVRLTGGLGGIVFDTGSAPALGDVWTSLGTTGEGAWQAPDTGTDDQTASEVNTSTTNFDNNLSPSDTTVQAALETLDELTTSQATNTVIEVEAASGTITKGQVVYVSGFDVGSGFTEVDLADSDSSATMPALGIALGTITTTVSGYVTVSGSISDIDTSGFAAGDNVYVSGTAGALTATRPTGTALVQNLGIVARSHASQGVVEVIGSGRSNDVPNLVEGMVYWDADSNPPAPEKALQCESQTIENLKAADDNLPLWGGAPYTVEPMRFWVHCMGTCTTTANISFEDLDGNAVSHGTITASTSGAATAVTPTTTTFLAFEGLAIDVDNTPVPETDKYVIGWCWRIADAN